MHTSRWLAAFGLACLLAVPVTAAPGDTETCGRFGTSVTFVDTPSEAAAQARKDEKLVLILHVSGHFETPEFT